MRYKEAGKGLFEAYLPCSALQPRKQRVASKGREEAHVEC